MSPTELEPAPGVQATAAVAAFVDSAEVRARGGAGAAETTPPLTVISPRRGWFEWRLGQLWRYRDLILLFVWRDFVALYNQTILGPLWHVLRPLATTVVFTVVFARMAALSTDGTPAFVFYLTGQVAWVYFATCLESISRTFVSNAHLLGKVYFHRLVIPVSVTISNLIPFAIQFVFLLAVLIYLNVRGAAVHLTPWIVAVPLVPLALAGYALGCGILACALTIRYRDLAHLVSLGIQLMMFVTPVIYPLSAVPERYRWIAELNPLTPFFEMFRLGLLGAGTVSVEHLLWSLGSMFALLVLSVTLFNRVERTFMDTV